MLLTAESARAEPAAPTASRVTGSHRVPGPATLTTVAPLIPSQSSTREVGRNLPTGLPPSQIAALQRLAGNAAVRRLLRPDPTATPATTTSAQQRSSDSADV